MHHSDDLSEDDGSLQDEKPDGEDGLEEDRGSNVSRAQSEVESLIGKQETVVVTRLRLVLLCSLAISAVGVAIAVYTYLERNEEAAFRAQYRVDSNKILSTAGNTLASMIGAFDSVALMLISHARATNQTWPFVTVPNFALRMGKIVPLCRTINMNVLPLVTPAKRKEWETYALHNDYWVNETVDVQRDFKNYYGPDEYDTMPHNILHGDFDDIPYDDTYVHMPWWMI
jgi:hypothetical protein